MGAGGRVSCAVGSDAVLDDVDRRRAVVDDVERRDVGPGTIDRRRGRSIVRLMAGAFVLAACGAQPVATATECSPSPWVQDIPLVIAHASGSVLAPGNSVLGLERAVEAGADVLDLDVRMSADGVLVARHDRDVARTTDGVGNVDELTWDELAALDLAARWDGDAQGPVQMARVDEALRQYPEFTFSLELKQTRPSMSAALCSLLDELEAFGRVYVSANDDAAVYDAVDTCGELLAITTTYRDLAERRAADEAGITWCASSPIGQPPMAGRSPSEMKAFVERGHARGSAIFGWTLNSETDILNAIAAGVDGIYTDRPDLARTLISRTTNTP